MSNPLSRRDFIQTGALAIGAFAVSSCTGLNNTISPPDEAKVFFTPELTAAGLLKAYAQINHDIGGKVAISYNFV